MPGMPPPREKQIKTLERLGEAQIKYLLANPIDPHSDFDRYVAEEWLRHKEDERTAASTSRRDAREEETLSIANRAAEAASEANRIASESARFTSEQAR